MCDLKETPIDAPGNVNIVVVGPQNAKVLVDGQLLANWFGTTHELSAGQHLFEFQPPGPECCEGPVTETVNVESGKTIQVRGVIPWKPAVLEYRGSPLSTASCEVFGEFKPNTSKTIQMQSARQHVTCNVIPGPTSGEQPNTVDVELIAGRTSSFPRP